MSDEFLPPESIGFIGLGNMGAPMARHLVAGGYRVMAADADRATLERFCGSASCERARTLSDLGRSCRLVITMLPDGAAVRQVLLGEQGVAAGLVPGSLVLDMSSAEPLGTRELGRTLAATAEAMLAGESFGIEPATMLEILNHSTGRNSATEQKYPAFVLPRSFNSGFALGLMAKDLRIALGLAESLGTPSALLTECAALWSHAERLLGFSADNTEIVKYLERSQRAGADE